MRFLMDCRGCSLDLVNFVFEIAHFHIESKTIVEEKENAGKRQDYDDKRFIKKFFSFYVD